MLKKLFVCAGLSFLMFWSCSEKQDQTNNSVLHTPTEKKEREKHSEINFDFSIELIGEPIDTTGEIWNVKGIDIYSSDSLTPVQQIKYLNTLTPVGRDFSGGFMVDDYNFDGTNDFRLIKIDEQTNEVQFHFWLFNKEEKKFIPCFQLDSIPSPQFDFTNHFILSEYETDTSLVSDTYKIINNNIKLEERNVKIVSQESISVKNYKTENGRLILIKEETVTGK